MRRSSRIFAVFGLLSTIALSACASASTPAPQATTAATATAPQAAGTKAASADPTAAPAAPAAKPPDQAPKYGGTLNSVLNADISTSTWDDATFGGPGGTLGTLTNQELWTGDWSKGIAGGYGAQETDWAVLSYDIFAHKTGSLVESWKVDVDNATQEATIVYKLRPGVRYYIDPNNEASKLVGGREVNADDVMAAIQKQVFTSTGFLFRASPELRTIQASKTGPMEITIKLPLSSLVTGLSRISDAMRIYPTEVNDKQADWKNRVGTGPFMITDYVAGSTISFKRNPSFWEKDPAGPGKGNQLPYVDGITYYIVPDASTRLAAFRTAKVDALRGLNWEDAAQTKKEFPQMPFRDNEDGGSFGGFAIYMRTDKPPYNDKRVRHAMMLATDFNTIKQTINGGTGNIVAYPYTKAKGYEDLYVGLEDPDLPPAVKDLYTYNPDKARKLLAEAGFPDGLKTSILTTSAAASYYEMIASMWAKAGITLAIEVKDLPGITQILQAQQLADLTSGTGRTPVAVYYGGTAYSGVPSSSSNLSYVDDPYIKEMLPKIRLLAGTDEKQAMKLGRELTKYAMEQAWAIPVPNYASTTFWWPWLKHYSGEVTVGYSNGDNWAQYVWIDQELKKSMGH